jgi:hypothetical protein
MLDGIRVSDNGDRKRGFKDDRKRSEEGQKSSKAE